MIVMNESVANRKSFAVGPSPYDLKPAEVMDLVQHSEGSDWLYSDEDDVYNYRKNLLIRMEGQHAGSHEYLVYFGAQPVFKADVRQVFKIQSVSAALAV